MTRRRSQTNQQVGALKALILTGSVVATLAGTRLLALQESSQTTMSGSASESRTLIVPADDSASALLTANKRGMQLELKAIPQAVRPKLNPVARTRSSR